MAGGSTVYHRWNIAGAWGFKEYRVVTNGSSNVLGRKVRRILP